MAPRTRFRLAGLALVAGLVLGVARPDAIARGERPEPVQTYVVREGETLWSLAHRVRRWDDPRRLIEEIRRLNRLKGAVIVPGQELELPHEVFSVEP
ncbi:MAG: LysM peptidoglycan-binding domain-containing protein [Actinomycetota bacterium]